MEHLVYFVDFSYRYFSNNGQHRKLNFCKKTHLKIVLLKQFKARSNNENRNETKTILKLNLTSLTIKINIKLI